MCCPGGQRIANIANIANDLLWVLWVMRWPKAAAHPTSGILL
jgi:hypothetical protein